MSVLITGASGFLGSLLVDRFLSNGIEVKGIGRKKRGLLKKNVFENPLFNYYQIDLTSKETLSEVNWDNIDVVFHLSSQQPRADLSFDDYYQNNVISTCNLIEWSKKFSVNQFIFTSSTAVHSEMRKEIICENTYTNPSSYYGVSKLLAEQLIRIELRDSPIKSSIIRFPSIFGQNHRGGIVYFLLTMAYNNSLIELYSNGQKYRNLIFEKSAVDILYKCYKKEPELDHYEIFTVGSLDSVELFDIASVIVELLHSKSIIERLPKVSPTDSDVIINNSKAISKLSFNPISIKASLELYIKSMKR